MSWALLLAFLTGIPGARAACTPVQLDTPGGSMEKVPVLDQGQINDCYAVAGTELFMAYRFSKTDADPAHISSATAAALGSGQHDGHTRLTNDGGVACHVANYLRDYGSCDRSRVIEGVEKVPDDWENYQDVLSDAYDDYQKALAHVPLGEQRDMFRTHTAERLAACLKSMGAPQELVPSVPRLGELLDNPGHPLGYLRGILAAACPDSELKRWPLPAFECKIEGVSKKSVSEVLTRIDQRLDMPHAQPVAFSHCTALLEQDKRTPVGIDHAAGKFNKECNESRHVALVIGRRPDPKHPERCQYRVRNVWGTDCDGYYSDLWECQSGNLWVDGEAIANNTYSLQYIDETPAGASGASALPPQAH